MFAVDRAFLVNGDIKWICMATFPTRKDCRGLMAWFNGWGRVRPTQRALDGAKAPRKSKLSAGSPRK